MSANVSRLFLIIILNTLTELTNMNDGRCSQNILVIPRMYMLHYTQYGVMLRLLPAITNKQNVIMYFFVLFVFFVYYLNAKTAVKNFSYYIMCSAFLLPCFV